MSANLSAWPVVNSVKHDACIFEPCHTLKPLAIKHMSQAILGRTCEWTSISISWYSFESTDTHLAIRRHSSNFDSTHWMNCPTVKTTNSEEWKHRKNCGDSCEPKELLWYFVCNQNMLCYFVWVMNLNFFWKRHIKPNLFNQSIDHKWMLWSLMTLFGKFVTPRQLPSHFNGEKIQNESKEGVVPL